MNASKKSVHIFDEKLWPPPRKVSTIHTLHHNYYFNKVEQVNHEIKEESDTKGNLNDSLLHHIKASKDVIRRCSQMYELSKNDIESRRLDESKKLEKEIERDKEKYKRALIVQQQASNRENRAAITIQRFYSIIDLKKKVREMNANKHSKKMKEHEKLSQNSIIIQKSYRSFSVRMHFNRSCTDGFKELSADIILSRAKHDYLNHRVYQRKKIAHHCQMLIETLSKNYDNQENWIINCYNKDEKKVKELQTRAYDLSMDLKNTSAILSSLAASNNDKHADLHIQFRKIKAKQRHNDFLCDLYKKLLFLLLKHRRHISRLVTKSKVLSQYSNEYFLKVGKDWDTLNTVQGLITKRLDSYSDSADNNNFFCYEWLSDQKINITNLLVNYDTNQETTLERELKRLEKEINLITSAKNAMIEVFQLIHAEVSYESENVGSEIEYITAVEGSEKGLEISESMEALSEKLKILRGSV